MKHNIGIPLRSLLIWFTTNLAGAFLLFIYLFFESPGEPVIAGLVLVFGLLFSAPVIALLIPSLYVLRSISSKEIRIAYSVLVVPVLCAAVIGFVQLAFDFSITEDQEMMMFFIPYIIAAWVIYFLFTWKMITGNAVSHEDDTTPIDTDHL